MLRRGGWVAGCSAIGVLGVLLGGLGYAQDAAPVVAVSKPPPPAVPSDPPQGRIFALTRDMSASSVTFVSGDASDTSEGPQSLEYLRWSRAGDAYITFDDGPAEAAPGGVMVVADFLGRAHFDASRDRLITGERAGLVEPKDLVVADGLGAIIVADFAESKVAVFDLQADGDAAPRFVTSDLGATDEGEPRRPWGLAYDADADRLFVGGTDGAVLVFDAYLVNRGERGPDRVIIPTLEGEQTSANVHDLVYVAAKDMLIATDVGAATTADQAGFDVDGKVFVLEDASTLSGAAQVRAQIAGPATLLGNPVGAAWDGSHLYITEKTKDVVLRFGDVLSLSGAADLAPSGAVTVPHPEAVTVVPETLGSR